MNSIRVFLALNFNKSPNIFFLGIKSELASLWPAKASTTIFCCKKAFASAKKTIAINYAMKKVSSFLNSAVIYETHNGSFLDPEE